MRRGNHWMVGIKTKGSRGFEEGTKQKPGFCQNNLRLILAVFLLFLKYNDDLISKEIVRKILELKYIFQTIFVNFVRMNRFNQIKRDYIWENLIFTKNCLQNERILLKNFFAITFIVENSGFTGKIDFFS